MKKLNKEFPFQHNSEEECKGHCTIVMAQKQGVIIYIPNKEQQKKYLSSLGRISRQKKKEGK